MTKHPLSPAYLLFFLLFWPHTYRILIGVCAAVILTPRIIPPDQGGFGTVMMYVMLACIGYAGSAKPAQAVSTWLKKKILKNKQP